ncbi:VOC family protein [Sphaerochaeta sp. PS]|jgi:glyoxalase/bleomycin resistance protein/dioxygenase superfamily protein|uniref:VOC family protein n=1 Tax=Sphaerochaeta sp. PS TaxID=3076336 RepID=UPI0028A3397D|nr:VOC family protein [Sphaerochaeta sp. PS]MDT4762305.1 VOC family protein [Sphaerochaeta sp. PS]
MPIKEKLSILDSSIGQLGFVVENVDTMIQGYYEKFGIGDWKIYTYGPQILSFMTYKGEPTCYSSRIALGYFGSTRIELIQPLKGHTVYTDFIEKHGYGLQHLGIYVQNMKSSLEIVKKNGISVIMEGGGFGLDGDGHYAYLDTEELYGICYELIQRPLRRREPERVYPFLNSTFSHE